MFRLRPLASVVVLALGGMILGPPAPAAGQGPDPVGEWSGVLEVPGARLRIVFHVEAVEAGFAATMDSPDQGARGIPAGPVVVEGDTLTIGVPAVGGEYRGRLTGDTLSGRWSQAGQSFALDLVRGEAAGEGPPPPVRPQHPEPPYPYSVEDVVFANPAAGIRLAGTLTLPEGSGPFPGVVLVSGSGPQTRDEVVAGHRIFHVLADHLTRRGIAVLRYDDRGVGESEGDFSAATSPDFALDAAAAVAFLRTRVEVDGGAVGVVGHSEGGLVAPMVAREDDLAFVVLLAGPAVDGTEILVSQTAAMQRASGVPQGQVAANERAIRAVGRVLTTRPESVWADEVRAALLTAVPTGVPAEQSRQAVEPQVASFATPWMAFFVGYDPRPALESLEIPVLALNGSLDLQVLADVNLPPMREALGTRSGVTVEELPGLNHLFQPAQTGLPAEYSTIETTFDPSALEIVSTWILEVTAG